MELDPLRIALFLCLCMTTAGVAQVLWLRIAASQRFLQPVDGGATLRGRRLFGDNKTLRGFVVMVPVSGLAFAVFSRLFATGLWDVSLPGWVGLGLLAGFGFMAGELPNSFLKRQADVPPGEAPENPILAMVSLVLDRTDSLLGALILLWLVVPLPALAAVLCLVIGVGVHALFSWLLYKLGVKRRAG